MNFFIGLSIVMLLITFGCIVWLFIDTEKKVQKPTKARAKAELDFYDVLIEQLKRYK